MEMYKLLLVDDEEEVRRGILKKIDWESYGFVIAGEAENGREALEIAERVIPDVVVTDIKMPFMDGLKLSELLRSKLPTTKIVILTGFDEFEYAQKAIKLNIIEYILKPVSSAELTDVLVKVKVKLDEEIARKEDMQTLREHYRKSLPVLREKFLSSLVTSRMKRDEIREKSNLFNINLSGNGFAVSVFSIDTGHTGTNPAGSAFCLPEDWELLKFAVFNIAEEFVEKYKLGTIFIHNDYIVLILNTTGDESNILTDFTFVALDGIRQSIEKYLRCTVTIGVGTACRDITGISSSFENAVNALDYRVVLGNNRIICIEDVEPGRMQRLQFDDVKERSLYSCIKVGNSEEIKEAIEGFFKEIMDVKASIKDYQIYLLQLLTTVLKAAKDLNVDVDRIFGPNYNLFVELYKFKTVQEAMNWVIGICTRIMGHIRKERQNTCKVLADKAKEFIQSHYHESDLTIEKVCKHLYISSTYFSIVFKKETKLTFLNYLTQVRMEAAKELLRTTNLKAFEIAEKVGYSEPHYFSYSFKKNFSISPSEYRNETHAS